MEKRKEEGKISKIIIPEDDIDGWKDALKSGGLSKKETEKILQAGNPDYGKEAREKLADEILKKRVEKFLRERKMALTSEQREYHRKGIMEGLLKGEDVEP